MLVIYKGKGSGFVKKMQKIQNIIYDVKVHVIYFRGELNNATPAMCVRLDVLFSDAELWRSPPGFVKPVYDIVQYIILLLS